MPSPFSSRISRVLARSCLLFWPLSSVADASTSRLAIVVQYERLLGNYTHSETPRALRTTRASLAEAVFGAGKLDFKCLGGVCDCRYPPSEIRRVLPPRVLHKYEERLFEVCM